MIDFFKQATALYMLPLTIGLGFVVVYWMFAMVGAVTITALDWTFGVFDGDVAGDLGGDGSDTSPPPGGSPLSVIRMINGADIPATIVLSVLGISMWTFSMVLNFYFNPEREMFKGVGFVAASLPLGAILAKLVTQPFVPFMRRLKDAENAKPVIGETGVVRSISVTNRYGQVEVVREDGAPAILNCRIENDALEIPRGTTVIILSYDEIHGQYFVAPASVKVS